MTLISLKMRSVLSMIGKLVLILLVAFVLFLALVYIVRSPQNDRVWSADQAVLPSAEFKGDTVTIRNVRNFSYASRDAYTPAYYDKTYDLRTLVSVDYIVEPLAEVAAAHTFLSFGFENGDYVAISIEIRKEEGEEFSPWRGLLGEYELMYVVVDERDTVRLRALHRDNPVYLYPARIPTEEIRPLFTSMLERANKLRESPEFYNTITNSCTTNIADHINERAPGKVPWDVRLIAPLDSDEYAYELGLIDTSVPLAELRRTHQINDAVRLHADAPDFSVRIRRALREQGGL